MQGPSDETNSCLVSALLGQNSDGNPYRRLILGKSMCFICLRKRTSRGTNTELLDKNNLA